MNNSTFMAGIIFAAFLIFITARGELPAYMGLLLSPAPAPTPAPAPATNTKAADAAASAQSTGIDVGDLVSTGIKIAAFL